MKISSPKTVLARQALLVTRPRRRRAVVVSGPSFLPPSWFFRLAVDTWPRSWNGALQQWKHRAAIACQHSSRHAFVLAVTAAYLRGLGSTLFVLLCHCPSFKGSCSFNLLPTPSKRAPARFAQAEYPAESTACPRQLPGSLLTAQNLTLK